MRPSLASDFREGNEDVVRGRPCDEGELSRGPVEQVPGSVVVVFFLPPALEHLEHLVLASLDAMSC